MGDSIFIEFSTIKQEFTIKFLEGYIKALFPKEKKLEVAEYDRNTAKFTHTKYTLQEVAKKLYNHGKGESLSVNYRIINKYVYAILVHAHPNKKGIELGLSIDRCLLDEHIAPKVIPDFIERCKSIYNYAHPEYGRGDWGLALEDCDVDNIKKSSKHIYWINFYGPKLTTFGTDAINSIPYGFAEKLPDGGAIVLRGKFPNDNDESMKKRHIHEILFGKKLSLIEKIMGKHSWD